MFGQFAFAELPDGGAVVPFAPLAGVVVVAAGVVVVEVAVDELVAAFAMTAPAPERAPITIVVASAL